MDSSSASSSTAAEQAPAITPEQQQRPYQFPTYRLRTLENPAKKPLILVVCGSFSPVQIMHLRMCEVTSDFIKFNDEEWEVVGIYMSPVSDAYRKVGLVEARHRLKMCELAIEDSTNCLMVDPWEAIQPEYVPTAKVLEHFKHEVNDVLGGITSPDGEKKPARVALVAGADLLMTMSTPGVWSEEDLKRILNGGGMYVVDRIGTDMEEARSSLSRFGDAITVVPEIIPFDLSSTKVRLSLKKKMSVRYFVPLPVLEYIAKEGLYSPDATAAATPAPSSSS